MTTQHSKTYSIGDAVKMTNITERQLRNWEGKYIPMPVRIQSGERSYRRYTEEQIEIIKEMKVYIDQGYTLRRASELVAKMILAEQ